MEAMMGWGIEEQGGWRKGPWSPQEDKLLAEYVNVHGEGRWSGVARGSGLNRSGKSCRLRWVNYLRPGLKRGQITPQEEGIIIELHALWGNKWSAIARYLPGRTDNEIKNYWRTHFKKKDTKKQDKRRSQILKQKLHPYDNHAGHHQLQPKEEETSMKGASPTHVEDKTTTSTTHELQSQDDQYHQRQDQMVSRLPNSDDHQGECYNPVMINQDVASWWDTMGDFLDYGSWGDLWNLDDPAAHDHHHHGRMDNGTTTAGLKLATQNNQAVATYCGGNSNIRAIENQANKAFSLGGDYYNNLYNYQGYSF
ncbi:hypothetical protein FNV43_RR14606 [Rhamnella rubrinervis]|uniref:Uncharacterized protein n=1 Tax=Rhamnella rubrinervis TaxID=2594499 RepID=A0A8K0H3M8_9ROSA|nr:hypothetical protein FNV43_RR14606 [Rhamnella rubrinervis]